MITFADQFAETADQFQVTGNLSTLHGRSVSAAIRDAYDEIARKHKWSYYIRRALINTSAAYSTGTVGYNANSNVLTISGGTWPQWVLDGEVIINQNIYKPGNVLSSTTISIRADRKPSRDISPGSPFCLFQASYPLPSDFLQLMNIEEISKFWKLTHIPPADYHSIQNTWLHPGTPTWYSVTGSNPRRRGTFSIDFMPPPIDERTVDILYRAVPRRRTLNTTVKAGTVSTSGATATITGGTINSDVEGCVVRFGSESSVPSGPDGQTPPVFETVVQQVLSSTTFLLESTPPQDISDAKYTIDDPVDIDEVTMRTLFSAMCSTRFARRTMKEESVISRLEKIEQGEFLRAVSSNERTDMTLATQWTPLNLKEMTFMQLRR